MYLYTSHGIGRIAGLDVLLGETTRLYRVWQRNSASAVIGWGCKPTTQKARKLSARLGIPYVSIEDGLLRSVNLGDRDSPLSLVVDDLGIYYDASKPSRLEMLISQPLSQTKVERIRAVRLAWQTNRVSKYNHQPEYQGEKLPERYVLVVDQTLGDASVQFGLANEQSFNNMLDAALAENPDCIVVIKIHPDVFCGRKKGYFDIEELSAKARVRVLVEDVHPVSLIEQSQAIYVVTSQMGFEGLMWGKRVRTFGMPFYAGWGLTHDELAAPDRRGSATLDQLIHAALIDYARYIDPETEQRCEVERVVEWMGLQRRMRSRFPKRLYAVNFLPWKHRFVGVFFQGADLHFVEQMAQVPEGEATVCWGVDQALLRNRNHGGADQTNRKQKKAVCVEDGFLRSVGLGADVVQPISWVIDYRGIYYDATRPSDLEHLLLTTSFDDQLLARSEALQAQIVASGLTKYNVGSGSWAPSSTHKNQDIQFKSGKIILVPGQVESDASIALGAQKIRRNIDLLQAVRKANPDAYIVYKPHPDVVAGLRRRGKQESDASLWCDEIVDNAPVDKIINAVDEVHVLTSLTGFEALLRHKKVVTYGQPFYSGWGLTEDQGPVDRRNRTLSLSELVAATLILYPTYISVTTGRFTTPERVLHELSIWKSAGASKVSLSTRLRRLVIRYIVKVD
jgi:capsular polysaccharide export protein